MAPKDDHVIIMRRTHGKCTYSLSRITHERDYDDHEYINMAINQGKEYQFGVIDACFKLYNSANAAIFYFENKEQDRVLNAEF